MILDLIDVRENFSLFLFPNVNFILACQYGRTECDFGATCTFEDECQCIFHCNDTDESIRDDSTGILYPNPCRLNEAQCHSYYQPASKTGMCRRRRRNEKITSIDVYLVDSTCSSIICSHGSKCLIDGNGLARCYCPDNCNEYNDRISSVERLCGSDNQTYETICELNKRACQTQQNLTVAYQGPCRMLIFSLLKKNFLILTY